MSAYALAGATRWSSLNYDHDNLTWENEYVNHNITTLDQINFEKKKS